jgi:hypothetical protein
MLAESAGFAEGAGCEVKVVEGGDALEVGGLLGEEGDLRPLSRGPVLVAEEAVAFRLESPDRVEESCGAGDAQWGWPPSLVGEGGILDH